MQDLSSLNVGDYLAVPNSHSYGGLRLRHRPAISHNIFKITARTATQFKACNSFGKEARIRIADGMLIGERTGVYVRAMPATPEILAQHKEQRAAIQRFNAAAASLEGLVGKELHQLNLTTEQMEHLGKAWAEVQAMAHPTDQHHAG